MDVRRYTVILVFFTRVGCFNVVFQSVLWIAAMAHRTALTPPLQLTKRKKQRLKEGSFSAHH